MKKMVCETHSSASRLPTFFTLFFRSFFLYVPTCPTEGASISKACVKYLTSHARLPLFSRRIDSAQTLCTNSAKIAVLIQLKLLY